MSSYIVILEAFNSVMKLQKFSIDSMLFNLLKMVVPLNHPLPQFGHDPIIAKIRTFETDSGPTVFCQDSTGAFGNQSCAIFRACV